MSLAPQLHPHPGSQKKALVVGADAVVAAQVSATLPTWKIEHAANNLDALKSVEARQFDLVLTSENTSAKTDVELLCEIRRVRPHIRSLPAGQC